MSIQSPGNPWRVGAVSYFNTRPLTFGLDACRSVRVARAVPAKLPGMLRNGDVDAALVPAIDLVRSAGRWQIISDACIGCDGPTLTVRVFSKIDPSEITRLHVDPDSHSSVALAAVLWRERYGRDLILNPLPPGAGFEASDECQAVLLIGDKVIRPPVAMDVFSTQIDLGTSWKAMTGLGFVFAVWAAEAGRSFDELATKLSSSRDAGVDAAAEIARRDGPDAGFSPELARTYLTQCLNFTLTPRHREGMELFFELARRYGMTCPADELLMT